MEIKLGDEARHVITGYRGIVIAETTWRNGCQRFALKSKKLHDGQTLEEEWFDSQEVERISPGLNTRERGTRSTGGRPVGRETG